MAGIPVLADGVVTLRPHEMSDVDEIIVQCTDPDSIRWTTVPTPYDRAMAESYVTTTVPGGWETRRDLNFAIEAEHPDGVRKFSGSIALRPMEEGQAELAFGLHPAVRGRGVCSRAVKLILDWGFTQPDIDVAVWFAYVGNWGSWRVAWANGFTFHGTVKQLLTQRGERRDSWFGSLRADEYREPKHKWHVAPVLESDRLRLRQHRLDDGPRYMELLTDERSRHFGGWNSWVHKRELTGEFVVNRALEANARGDRFDWTIADRATDEFAGQIQLFNLDELDSTAAEIGYSVHPSRRGQGVLTEALGMLVEWSFRRKEDGGLGLRKLSLGTAASNEASRHGAEKAGFTHVATLPDGFPAGERGTFDDETVYQQLNPAWQPSWLESQSEDAHPRRPERE
jgi:[ribosomal protein S5]-alanine N-acetyltransferase